MSAGAQHATCECGHLLRQHSASGNHECISCFAFAGRDGGLVCTKFRPLPDHESAAEVLHGDFVKRPSAGTLQRLADAGYEWKPLRDTARVNIARCIQSAFVPLVMADSDEPHQLCLDAADAILDAFDVSARGSSPDAGDSRD